MKRTKLLQEPDNDNIDLRNIIIEDKKEEADNSNVGAPGRPNNYYFNGLKWTEAPHDVKMPLDYFLLVNNCILTKTVCKKTGQHTWQNLYVEEQCIHIAFMEKLKAEKVLG